MRYRRSSAYNGENRPSLDLIGSRIIMTNANAASPLPGTDNAFFGHPLGLFVCFATEMWERFSFYGMKFLLLLYLTKYHLFSDSNGLEVLGSYAALVYAMPVIGGLLADRYLGSCGRGSGHSR